MGQKFMWNKYGIGNKTVKWIEDFLYNRYQQVVVNGCFFLNFMKFKVEFPKEVYQDQYYSFYTLTICQITVYICKLFADDKKLYRNISNPDDTLILQSDFS